MKERFPDRGPIHLTDAWYDWLICKILFREAEAAILYDPIFPADPFAP